MNKKGGPDRRFNNNPQLPVMLYCSLNFTSLGGLNEEFQISNVALVERFTKACNEFQASFIQAGQGSFSGLAHENRSPHPIALIADPAKNQTGGEHLDVAVAFAKGSEKARTLALEH